MSEVSRPWENKSAELVVGGGTKEMLWILAAKQWLRQEKKSRERSQQDGSERCLQHALLALCPPSRTRGCFGLTRRHAGSDLDSEPGFSSFSFLRWFVINICRTSRPDSIKTEFCDNDSFKAEKFKSKLWKRLPDRGRKPRPLEWRHWKRKITSQVEKMSKNEWDQNLCIKKKKNKTHASGIYRERFDVIMGWPQDLPLGGHYVAHLPIFAFSHNM